MKKKPKVNSPKKGDRKWKNAEGNRIKIRKDVIEKYGISYAFLESWYSLNLESGLPIKIPAKRTYYQMTMANDPGVTWETFYHIVTLIARCYKFSAETTFASVADNLTAIPPAFLDQRIVESSTSTTEVEGIMVGFQKLFNASFEFCIERLAERSLKSSTCVHLFGVGFDARDPVTVPASCVLTIGTELDHLEQVLAGIPQNPEKEHGVDQITDEIVDCLRQGFILAIAVEIKRVDARWLEQFKSGFSAEKARLRGWTELQKLHIQLRAILVHGHAFGSRVRSRIGDWLQLYFRELGRLASSSEVTFKMLHDDLAKRLSKKSIFPEEILEQRMRVPYALIGVYAQVTVTFPDKPGAYAQLIEFFSREGFDLWATRSRVIVPGESAEVVLLARLEKSCLPKEKQYKPQELEQRLRELFVNKIEQLSGLDTYHICRGGKLVSNCSINGEIHFWRVKSQAEFYEEVSQALIEFDKSTVKSAGRRRC